MASMQRYDQTNGARAEISQTLLKLPGVWNVFCFIAELIHAAWTCLRPAPPHPAVWWEPADSGTSCKAVEVFPLTFRQI